MKHRPHAFTLMECVLALGVIATVLVVLMGLLPAGLDATRAAAKKDVEALILERLRQEATTAPVSGLKKFDAYGSPVSGNTSGSAYTADVELLPDTALPGDDSPSLRTVRITLKDTAAGAVVSTHPPLVHHLLLAPIAAGSPP